MVNATKKWIFLKASSIILIPLMLWFIINLVSIYEKDYIDIVSFFSTQPSKFLTSLLIIVAFFYSSLNISEIFEDYIHDENLKNIANKTMYALSVIIPFLTIIVIFNLNISYIKHLHPNYYTLFLNNGCHLYHLINKL